MEKKPTADVKTKRRMPPPQTGEKRSLGNYLRGVRTEVKKVVWPTRKELISYTTVVLFACTAFALLFWAFDSGFITGLQAVLSLND